MQIPGTESVILTLGNDGKLYGDDGAIYNFINTSTLDGKVKKELENINNILDRAQRNKSILTTTNLEPMKGTINTLIRYYKEMDNSNNCLISKSVLSYMESIDRTLTGLLEQVKTPVIQQRELWPTFQPQKTVELKKEFALNFGGLDKIEKKYPKLLNEKLHSGMTLQQHLDKVRNWFTDLHGEDLGNWIKLFSYVKAVKEFSNTNDFTTSFKEVFPGRYQFKIKQNKDFFNYFIRPDNKTGQFTTKAKYKFLKWLHENQNTIEFPIIIENKVWNIPMRIYEYAENVSDKEILFIVDTNILESEFKDYVSININEIDAIAELWEKQTKERPEFKTYSLNNFIDIPLKLGLAAVFDLCLIAPGQFRICPC
jgi:hypothetical protein